MRNSVPASVRWALGVYAALARGLPADFRERFEREMVRDLKELLCRRRAERGPVAVWAGTARALWDLGFRLVREQIRRVKTAPDIAFERVAHGDRGRQGREERMMNATRELRLALRALLRKPGFAGVAVLTLGLGIGSVVAIFTVVNAILLQPLPYPDPDGILEIEHHAPAIDLPILNNSSGTLALYREHADVFSAVVGMDDQNRVLTGLDSPAQVTVMAATPEVFQVLRVQPAMGRPFGPSDALEGAPAVAVLLWDEWQARFGEDPDILGRTIELDGVSTEVVGVMPPEFSLLDDETAALVPLVLPGEPVFGQFGIAGLGRLKPGVTLEQARAQVKALQARIPERFPDITQETLDGFGWGVSLMTLKEDLVEDVATTLWLVLGTVGFVLLIACANVANLFLVRAEARQKEIAVRAAMGAGRSDIAASFLRESLVLGAAGGALGLLVAAMAVEALVTVGPQDVPRLSEVALTPTVLAFTALLSVGTGLVLGLFPMTRYSARAFAAILRDGGRGSTAGRGRNRARNLLVMSQLALALVLLVGSGLMFRSFSELRQVELGFEPDDVLTVGIRVGDAMPLEEAARLYQDLSERVASLPGVASVGVTTQLPLGTGNANGGSFYIESKPREEGQLPPVAMYRAVSPGYFETMGIEVLEGRAMREPDLDGTAVKVWVDRYFAETFLDGDAVGKRISWDGEEAEDGETVVAQWADVVGVVSNVKQQGLREEPMGQAYFPLLAGDQGYPALSLGMLAVKIEPGGDEAALAPAIREELAGLNGQVPVTQVRTMDDVVSQAMAGESITLVLLGIAAAMALFLGSIGLFGVISYVVSQRTREIGVRIALGAEKAEVSGMVLKQGLAVAAAGVALGLVAAFGLTRLMTSLLYQVSATDPVTFALAPVVLFSVSVLATWLPATRAARVDPVQSLREE